jgi:ribonuclease P protein component
MSRELRFPKMRRLTRTAEFQRVREEGEVARGELLSLSVLREKSGAKMRAGFITSRQVGGAVVRNRVRRRLREIVRRHQGEIVESVWIIVIARPRAARASYHALEHEWLRLAKRTSILAP